MGMFAMVTSLLLTIYFIILTILLFRQSLFALRERFKNGQRILLIGTMTVALCMSILYPGGLINFDKFEKDSILIAKREGAANCMTTLKLRDDNAFIERNVCYGVTETTGTYNIKGDTIYFDNVSLGRKESDFYKFAVMKNREAKNGNYLGDLVRYKDYFDTTGVELWIIKYELPK